MAAEDQVLADRYVLRERIGSGAMGVVFRAHDRQTARDVAIKRISAPHEASRARFLREVRALSAVRHPNIVEIVGSGRTHDGQAYIAMELLEGEDLDALILREKRLSWRRARALMVQLMRALHRAHEAGIVHRDIKPTNCFVVGDVEPTLKILDFGIARFLSEESELGMLTQTGMVLGTPSYMSPEQAAGQRVDRRTDLYAAAVILFRMVTGRLPFVGNGPLSVLVKHLSEAPPVPSACAPGVEIPPALDRVILCGLAKDPGQRFQSAADFSAALAAVDVDVHAGTLHFGRASGQLFGREGQRRQLVECLTASEAGRVVVVEGRAGSGKTALVRSALESADISTPVLISKAAEFGGAAPLAALLAALEQLLEERLAATSDSGVIARHLVEAVGPGLALLSGELPSLGALVGVLEPVEQLPYAEGELRLLEVVRRCFAALAVRPHVLWLDDFQWSDLATVRIVAGLVLEPPTPGLRVVATVRTDDAGRSALAELERRGVTLTRISLGALSADSVAEFVADVLSMPVAEVVVLAQVVFELTEGTPLFVRELLDLLMSVGALTFEAGRGRWTWDQEKIRQTEFPRSLASLLEGRLARVTPACMEVLRIAALVGLEVEVATIAAVSQRSEPEVVRGMLEAVQHKLVTASGELDISGVRYAFVHDSVRRAIVDDGERDHGVALHGRIGRVFLSGGYEREAAYHLNRAVTILTAQERLRLLGLNVAVGSKAKDMGALDVADEFLSAAAALVDDGLWVQARELAFACLLGLGEVHYLRGKLWSSEELLGGLAARAERPREVLEVASRRVALELIRGRHVEAVDAGCDALAAVGSGLPRTKAESERSALALLGRIRRLLDEHGVEALATSARGGAEVQCLRLQLLSELMSAAAMARPWLDVVVAAQLSLSSLLRGQVDASPHGYACLAFCVTSRFGPDDFARRLAELALRATQALGPSRYTARTHFVIGSIGFAFWPLQRTIEHLRVAMRVGIDGGDHVYASYAASHLLMQVFGDGLPLGQLAGEAASCRALTERTGVASSLATARIGERFVAILADASTAGELADAETADAFVRAELRFPLLWLHVAQLILGYYRCDLAACLVAIEHAEVLVAGHPWFVHALLSFFACLVAARGHGTRSTAELYERYHGVLEALARVNPEQFATPLHTVELAWASVTADDSLELVNFADAVVLEGERAGPMYAGLTWDIAGDYHRRSRREATARGCYAAARAAYRAWGAEGVAARVRSLGRAGDGAEGVVEPLDPTCVSDEVGVVD